MRLYSPFGTVEMKAHDDLHYEEGFAMNYSTDEQKMVCDTCGLVIVKTNEKRKTRNSVQSAWAIEHFQIVEWP